jgi:hypothetical protein
MPFNRPLSIKCFSKGGIHIKGESRKEPCLLEEMLFLSVHPLIVKKIS